MNLVKQFLLIVLKNLDTYGNFFILLFSRVSVTVTNLIRNRLFNTRGFGVDFTTTLLFFFRALDVCLLAAESERERENRRFLLLTTLTDWLKVSFSPGKKRVVHSR